MEQGSMDAIKRGKKERKKKKGNGKKHLKKWLSCWVPWASGPRGFFFAFFAFIFSLFNEKGGDYAEIFFSTRRTNTDKTTGERGATGSFLLCEKGKKKRKKLFFLLPFLLSFHPLPHSMAMNLHGRQGIHPIFTFPISQFFRTMVGNEHRSQRPVQKRNLKKIHRVLTPLMKIDLSRKKILKDRVNKYAQVPLRRFLPSGCRMEEEERRELEKKRALLCSFSLSEQKKRNFENRWMFHTAIALRSLNRAHQHLGETPTQFSLNKAKKEAQKWGETQADGRFFFSHGGFAGGRLNSKKILEVGRQIFGDHTLNFPSLGEEITGNWDTLSGWFWTDTHTKFVWSERPVEKKTKMNKKRAKRKEERRRRTQRVKEKG